MEQLSLDGFEAFEEVRKVVQSEPRLVVGKGGRMSVNKKAYADFFKGSKGVKFFLTLKQRLLP